MADAQPGPLSCLTFLNEGLLLPAGNRSVFLPTFALTVAYTAFVDHALTLAVSGLLGPGEMAAAYLLAALTGPTIRAVMAAAAVATYTAERHAAAAAPFRELLAEALRGGLVRAGPAATAADANALWLASLVGGGAALGCLRTAVVLTPRLVDLLVVLHLEHRVLQCCLGALSSLAVVVSLSEAEPGRHGTAAIRRAWRLTRENAAWSAVLVAAQGALGGVSLWYADAARGVACEHVVWTGYVLLSAGADVLGVCTATAFYYRCTERDRPAASASDVLLQPDRPACLFNLQSILSSENLN